MTEAEAPSAGFLLPQKAGTSPTSSSTPSGLIKSYRPPADENSSGNASRRRSAAGLRKSMGSVATPRAYSVLGAGAGEVNSSGLCHELTRLRNELRAAQRDAEALQGEVTVLKAALAGKDKALAKAAAAGEAQAQRLLAAEGALATKTKELSDAEAEGGRLRAEGATLSRTADRLTAQLAAVPKGNPYSDAVAALEAEGNPYSDAVAALEAEVKGAKAAAAAAADDARGSRNTLRAKDKELAAMEARVAEAQGLVIANKEQENAILDLKRQLSAAADKHATLQATVRLKGTEMEAAQQAAAGAAAEKEATDAQLAAATRDLRAAEGRAAELTTEAGVLREELTRVQAVAARATVRELKAGGKDEGVVPVAMHLEEVRYLRGDLERLQEKLAAAERSAAAAATQKEALHKRLDAAQAAAKAAAAKAPPGLKAELDAAKAALREQTAETTALREQLERAGPRVAAARGAQRRLERQVAALASQLREAGLQPAAAASPAAGPGAGPAPVRTPVSPLAGPGAVPAPARARVSVSATATP